jgi:hypothetical protein
MRSRLPGLDSATTIGVLTAAGVYLIYNNALPSIADIRTAPEHNNDAEQSRKHAAIMSAILVGGVFVIARDFNSYIISGAALVGIDLMYKHANAVNPGTGKADNVSIGRTTSSDDNAEVIALPDYSDVG